MLIEKISMLFITGNDKYKEILKVLKEIIWGDLIGFCQSYDQNDFGAHSKNENFSLDRANGLLVKEHQSFNAVVKDAAIQRIDLSQFKNQKKCLDTSSMQSKKLKEQSSS
ncbi:hypothetical protein Tco_1555851 [Tanacetum coccineum]